MLVFLMRYKTKAQLAYDQRIIDEKAHRLGLAVLSRRDAEFAGEDKYFDGKRCKFGHVAARYVASGQCVECAAEKRKKKRRIKKDAC
jgi:hypothetical protein